MKVSCPSCSAKYSIADEKVRNRLAKIRCRKCETTIVIDGKTDPPTIQAAEAGSGRSDEYTVDISDNDQRQMTVSQIVSAYNESLLNAETYVWKDGMADWEQLGNVPELNEALHRAAAEAAASVAPAVSVPPSTTFTSASPEVSHDLFGGGVGVGASTNIPRAATRGGGADLFGSIDRAGGETDLATSAHDPVPVQPATGARNESSVLFSLSALTGSEKAKPPAPAQRMSEDDSGLIDLGALAAKSDAGASDVVVASPLGLPGVSPLGAPLIGGTTAPLGADGSPVRTTAPNRSGLYIGGGIAFAALVAGAVILLKEPPPPAPGVIAIATALPAAPAEVAAPQEDSEKESEEAAKAEEEKEEDAKKEGAKNNPRKYVPKSPAKPAAQASEPKAETKSEAKSEKPAEEKKPKKSNCNCKAGDLMCAMKCSAK